jgi:hypothetical protein
MIRNRTLSFVLAFLSIAISPKPFICFGTLLGMYLLLNVSKLDDISIRVLTVSALIIGFVILSSIINETNIGYEEQKRLIGIFAVALNFIYFRKFLFGVLSTSVEKQTRLLCLFLAFLCSSFIWYRLKISGTELGYSWLKFYGACPLAIFLVQVSTHRLFSRFRHSLLLFGFTSGALLLVNEAKAASILAFVGSVAVHRFRSSPSKLEFSEMKVRNENGSRLLLFLFLLAFFIAGFWNICYRGFFGSRIQSSISEYGPNFFGAILNARPELPISFFALGRMPWYGFGTPENALQFATGALSANNSLSLVDKHLIGMRVLGTGLNVHSWFFEVLLRGGYFEILFLLAFVILLFRVLINPGRFTQFPGLYLVSLFTSFDVFFSPFTWFSPIQVGLTLLAYSLFATDSKERINGG